MENKPARRGGHTLRQGAAELCFGREGGKPLTSYRPDKDRVCCQNERIEVTWQNN